MTSDDEMFYLGLILGAVLMLAFVMFVVFITMNPSTTVSGTVGYTSTSDGSTTFIINGKATTCSLTASTYPAALVAIKPNDTVMIQRYSNNGACVVLQDTRPK
jgi:hypothetical protein